MLSVWSLWRSVAPAATSLVWLTRKRRRARPNMTSRAKMGGVDLNLAARYSEFFRGVAREHRQNSFRPTHGFSALEHVRADCCALRRRCSGANAVLFRAYRAMAFAQLTYRESLRDIEVCL